MKLHWVICVTLLALPMSASAADFGVLTKDGAFDSFFSELEKEKEAPYYTQAKDWAYIMVGRQDLTTARGGQTRCFSESDAVTYQPAEPWLIGASADARVLMLNELHDHVAPRAFVYRMLPALREQGFTHLAMEGLGVDKGEPLGPASGFYSQEPMFAALIRRAQALGFELVAYEHLPEENDVALREQGQAENLVAAIEAAGNNARFVVYAGGAHIAERPKPSGDGFIRWMAARFRELSGIDPLTVNLSDCAYHADSPFEARIAVDAERRGLVARGHLDGMVDAQIQLPVPTTPQLGFYRQVMGERTEIVLPTLAAHEPVLVRAWLPENTVPLDQMLVRPGESATLYLPAGKYRVTVATGDGTVVATNMVIADGEVPRD